MDIIIPLVLEKIEIVSYDADMKRSNNWINISRVCKLWNNIVRRIRLNNQRMCQARFRKLVKKDIENSLYLAKNDRNLDVDDALVAASVHDNVEVMKVLLFEARANPNCNGSVVLHNIIKNNNIEMAKIMLQLPGIVLSTNDFSPLIIIARHGHTELLELFIQDPRCNLNHQGFQALNLAAFFGHETIVDILLKNINIVRSMDLSSLFNSAIRANSLPVVVRLLEDERIANFTICDDCLLLAIEKNQFDIAKHLLKTIKTIGVTACNMALEEAFNLGNYELVELLLAYPSINPSGISYGMILSYSIQNKTDTLELFLQDNRLSYETKCIGAFALAIHRGDLQKTRELLMKDTIITEEIIVLALSIAIMNNRLDILKLLLNNIPNHTIIAFSHISLKVACQNNYDDIIFELVEYVSHERTALRCQIYGTIWAIASADIINKVLTSNKLLHDEFLLYSLGVNRWKLVLSIINNKKNKISDETYTIIQLYVSTWLREVDIALNCIEKLDKKIHHHYLYEVMRIAQTYNVDKVALKLQDMLLLSKDLWN